MTNDENMQPVAWRVECRWADPSKGGIWRKYADYGTLSAAHTSQHRFAVPGDIESRIVPLYPDDQVQALVRERDALLDEVERLRAALEVTPAPVTLEAAEWAIGVFQAEDAEMRADAARLDYIEKHARYDPKMDGNHAWWPTTFEHVLRGPTLRAAIDNSMKGGGS